MKKQDLLKIIDDEFLDKLYGFCYVRTNDSYEAQDLCSDIVLELVKSAKSDGEINDAHSFIWRTAKNVYADYCKEKAHRAKTFYQGDPDDVLPFIEQAEAEDDSRELLDAVYRQISFLTKAYREVMVMFYLDGLSTAEISRLQNTSEVAVRQRLFSARNKLRNEVNTMNETNNKPIALDEVEFVIWGNGNPAWGDPRNVCTRQFSKQIVKLCHQKPMTASEIASKLNVPTVYVEEELEILVNGANGEYGLLRRVGNGKYAINFILFDDKTAEKAHEIYIEQMQHICDKVIRFVEEHEKELLSLPYLNKKVDLNLILWQIIKNIEWEIAGAVSGILKEKYFADVKPVERPFNVYGYYQNGKKYGCGCNGFDAVNICGYSYVHANNISCKYVKPHFSANHNMGSDYQLQLALRMINGLKISALSEAEKEHAAAAVECGYLYRDGDMLYTKILVLEQKDKAKLYEIADKLAHGYFEAEAESIAEKIAALIRKNIPDHLIGEWYFANDLASLPAADAVIEALIERGVLTPPKDGVGAEGCWMFVTK